MSFFEEIISSEMFVRENKSLLISIIIPVYNEEHTIKNILNRIPNHLQYEIIIVNDGSTDKSEEQAKEIKSNNIQIISHAKNRGYGAAILTGFKHATGDVIITMDSDGQHLPEEIYCLIKPIINQKADITVGSRYLGDSNYKIPLHTRVGEFVINKCLRVLFHQEVNNNQSGFRAFSKKSLNIFQNMVFSKFALCTEVLFKAASNDLKIVEVPVNINQRTFGTSYVKLTKILMSISSCLLLYLVKRLNIGKFFPKRIFNTLNRIVVKILGTFF